MNQFVVGVDEVGRGCLAGPVYAAAVVFRSSLGIDEFKDSKLLLEPERETLSRLIHEHHWAAIGSASPQEIDQINILQASFLAMRRAIHSLRSLLPAGSELGILVDGHLRIPDLDCEQEPFVQGDSFIAEISAASIVAKVARDQLMKQMGIAFPKYGFERHKGYGCPEHRAAIKKFGPISLHRQSFSGVKGWKPPRTRLRATSPKVV